MLSDLVSLTIEICTYVLAIFHKLIKASDLHYEIKICIVLN